MKTKHKTYCTYCGKENLQSSKECKSCGRNLKEKDEELRNYLLGKVKSNVVDKISGGLLGTIQLIIRNYFYGIILSIAIIGATTSAIINENTNKSKIPKTTMSNVYQGLSNEQKIRGCWRQNKEDYLQIYFIFAKHNQAYYGMNTQKERFSPTYEITNGENAKISFVFELYDPNLTKDLDFKWINDTSFTIAGDNYFERVSCEEALEKTTWKEVLMKN